MGKVMACISVGEVIKCSNGTYYITDVLGVGGMGVVFRGRCLSGEHADKDVVIKVPNFFIEGNPPHYLVEKLRDETEILKKLDHPNIVRYYDEYTIECDKQKCNVPKDACPGRVFQKIPLLVIEYVNGIELREYIEKKGTLDTKTAIKFLIKLLDMLAYMHSKGIVWRDLNPRNILVNPSNVLEFKAIDFGTARQYREKGVVKATKVGYQGYTSPEQLLDGAVIPQCDVYSAGCTLFFLLTSRDPLPGGSLIPQNNIKLYNPSISDELARIIKKAMHPDVMERYQTTTEFKDDLQKLLISMGARYIKPYLEFGNRKIAIKGKYAVIGRIGLDVYLIQDDGNKVYITSENTAQGPFVSRYDPQLGKMGQVELMEQDGQWYIVRRGTNTSAIRRSNQRIVLHQVGAQVELKNGDVIELVYSLRRGPYIPLTFRTQ